MVTKTTIPADGRGHTILNALTVLYTVKNFGNTFSACYCKTLFSQIFVTKIRFFTGEGVAEVVVTSRQGAAGGDDAWVVMFVKWTVDSMFSAMLSLLARSDRIEKQLGLVKLLRTTTFSHIVLALIVSGVLVVSGVFWSSL